jgi:hypothetical protein
MVHKINIIKRKKILKYSCKIYNIYNYKIYKLYGIKCKCNFDIITKGNENLLELDKCI